MVIMTFLLEWQKFVINHFTAGAELPPVCTQCRFIFSSKTDYMSIGESEKTGAIFWVMVD